MFVLPSEQHFLVLGVQFGVLLGFSFSVTRLAFDFLGDWFYYRKRPLPPAGGGRAVGGPDRD